MGSVFLARDPVLKRSVAVKVLAPELAADETARTRFQREAQAVASLSHPNVVAIHSVGVLQTGAPYFVMQHVEGGNLDERLGEEGPLEVAEVKRILGQVASALEAAHSKGIIHRDVKPSNVLYDPESDRVLVSDFGIAAVRPGAGMVGSTQLTRTGALVGTPQYMSPEQLVGQTVTEKTDIYGLGLLAYELLTGESPFQGKSPQMVAAAHLKDEPPDLGEARGDVDPELGQIVRVCLDKDPDARPTAAEVTRRLLPSGGGLLEWPPPGLETLQGTIRRPAALLLGGSAAVLVPSLIGVAGGVYATTGWSSFAQTLGLAVALLGLVAVAVSVALLAGGFRRLRSGLARGHAWGTALEVMADARGDTGAVVTGSREYAGLSARARGSIRRGRLLRAGALLLAALLPIPLFVVMARLATAGLVTPGWGWLVPTMPTAVLLAFAGALAWWEHRQVAEGRSSVRRRSRPQTSLDRVIGPWYDRFRELVEDQPGAGPEGRPGAARAAGWLVAALVVVGVLIVLPVTAVTTSGGTILQIAVPRYGATEQRVREVEYGRRYRLPRDPAVTPIEASMVMARLAPRTAPPEPSHAVIRVAADTLQDPVYPPACDSAFGGYLPRAFNEIFDQAHAGLTPDQLACLRRIDAMPEFELLAVLARAPALDPWGAALELPLPGDAVPSDLSFPRTTKLRGLVYAAIGKAALASAEGRNEQAEQTLREVVSVGFLMMDESRYLIAALVGAVTARLGLDGLEDHYRVTGQDEAARRLANARDSAYGVSQAMEVAEERARSAWGAADPLTLRETTVGVVADTTTLPALRWEMLHFIAVLPCTNTRELLFGPSPTLREVWEQALSGLARTPADSAVFAVFEETLPRMARRPPANPLLRGVRVMGELLGSERLQGCAAVLGL